MEPTQENRLCFVLAPLGDPASDTRRRSDQILRYIIQPVCSDLGYQPIRADQIAEPGLITTQIIQRIVNARVVVADLTGWNPNVFYELALRHAVGKPYVQIIEKGERIPFDVAQVRTIILDHRDLDSVTAAREEIANQMRAMAESANVESPVSVAVELEFLRGTGKPEQSYLADIVAALNTVQSGVFSLGDRLLAAFQHEHEVLYHELRQQLRQLGQDTSAQIKFFNVIAGQSKYLSIILAKLSHRLGKDDPSLQEAMTCVTVLENALKEYANDLRLPPMA